MAWPMARGVELNAQAAWFWVAAWLGGMWSMMLQAHGLTVVAAVPHAHNS